MRAAQALAAPGAGAIAIVAAYLAVLPLAASWAVPSLLWHLQQALPPWAALLLLPGASALVAGVPAAIFVAVTSGAALGILQMLPPPPNDRGYPDVAWRLYLHAVGPVLVAVVGASVIVVALPPANAMDVVAAVAAAVLPAIVCGWAWERLHGTGVPLPLVRQRLWQRTRWVPHAVGAAAMVVATWTTAAWAQQQPPLPTALWALLLPAAAVWYYAQQQLGRFIHALAMLLQMALEE